MNPDVPSAESEPDGLGDGLGEGPTGVGVGVGAGVGVGVGVVAAGGVASTGVIVPSDATLEQGDAFAGELADHQPRQQAVVAPGAVGRDEVGLVARGGRRRSGRAGLAAYR